MKPEFAPDQDMRDVSPEDVAEAKKRARASKAYGKAMTNTPPAPMPMPPASAPKKYAKGGYVRSADGCAQRGKTKGRII